MVIEIIAVIYSASIAECRIIKCYGSFLATHKRYNKVISSGWSCPNMYSVIVLFRKGIYEVCYLEAVYTSIISVSVYGFNRINNGCRGFFGRG